MKRRHQPGTATEVWRLVPNPHAKCTSIPHVWLAAAHRSRPSSPHTCGQYGGCNRSGQSRRCVARRRRRTDAATDPCAPSTSHLRLPRGTSSSHRDPHAPPTPWTIASSSRRPTPPHPAARASPQNAWFPWTPVTHIIETREDRSGRIFGSRTRTPRPKSVGTSKPRTIAP